MKNIDLVSSDLTMNLMTSKTRLPLQLVICFLVYRHEKHILVTSNSKVNIGTFLYTYICVVLKQAWILAIYIFCWGQIVDQIVITYHFDR